MQVLLDEAGVRPEIRRDYSTRPLSSMLEARDDLAIADPAAEAHLDGDGPARPGLRGPADVVVPPETRRHRPQKICSLFVLYHGTIQTSHCATRKLR